ncbi:hypothetical protein F8S13_17415 [Chloroflexia bacterium SDU3-3]|nr:hypothetical protein F8S13_17415 [Chloroflexia bacterium SDU3-3]
MQLVITILTVVLFALSVYLWWREHSPMYCIALFAGMFGTLASPLWQLLYRFSYDPALGRAVAYLGFGVPGVVVMGGWLLVLPALLIFYLTRVGWWFSGYLSGWLAFVLFVVFHMLIEVFGTKAMWFSYDSAVYLPFGIQLAVISALMNALITLGTLSVLILSQRYALTSLLLILLPTPLVLSLFIHGLLGAPLYATLFLQLHRITSGWATSIGVLGTIGLLAWGAHTMASVLASQQGPRGI